ncbi:MAG: YicC family protein [Oscillospiraceae bacterium]|nr:YicC family protein [Oscillospiraceae bacterium]
MISSMTGYGRAQKMIDGREITVEIKSVNHRFFEFSPRISRSNAYLEEKLKSLVYNKISRGKVDLSLTMVQIEGMGLEVGINMPLAGSYLKAMRGLGDELGLSDDVTLTSLSRFGDIFIVRKTSDDEDAVWNAVREVAAEALEKLVSMRVSEGEKLKADVISRLSLIEGCVGEVERLAPQTLKDYKAKLTAKITEVLEQKQIDEARILTEAAIFAEKISVNEETVRLYSHIEQFRSILSSGEAVGRKLDFLVQELNRETNTIGSKAQDIGISKLVVEMKSEIEKIREQIQNIE